MIDLRELCAEVESAARGVEASIGAGATEDERSRRALAFLAERGWLRWAVPEQWGGAPADGLCGPDQVSVRALCALRQTLARREGLLDLALVEQGLGSYAIALAGRDALREVVLPEVAAGRRVAAFALTEDEAGSDLSRVATRATQREGGWSLRGAKTFITNAGIADEYTVLARAEGEPGDRDGLVMLRVPSSALGLEVRRFEVMAPHPIGEVVFNDVLVPEDDQLGAVGEGMDLALSVLARFRTSVAAAAVGFGQRALDESLARLQAREQFGRPLSTQQGLRFDLAEMDTRLRAAELLVELAARLVDEGGDATQAVARAKLFATETASWVCDRAVQHHGGLGVKRGTVVERLFREVRALRIYEGTSEVQKLILAKELLSRSKEEA